MLFDLNEACFDNLRDYWKALSSETEETSDSIYVRTGIDDPLYNPIFLKKNADASSLTKAKDRYSFWYDSKRNQTIPSTCFQHLTTIMQSVPMMSIHLDKEFKRETPPSISICMVENGRDLTDWISPIKIAFAMNEKTAFHYQRSLESVHKQFKHFMAKREGRVVAVASLFLNSEIAGLYNLAVLPEYRKQGIGTALHYARLSEAKKMGYQYATLQATPMAAALDASLGFETHSEISIYKV